MPTHIIELIKPGVTHAIITDGTENAKAIITAITGVVHGYTIADHMDGGALLEVVPMQGKHVNGVRRILFYDWATGVGADGMRHRHAVMRDNEHRQAAQSFGDDTAIVYIGNGKFEPTFTRAFPASLLFVPANCYTLRAHPTNAANQVLRSIRVIAGEPTVHLEYCGGRLSPITNAEQ